MKLLHMLTFVLVAIGGLNWGLIGFAGIMGNDPMSWNVVNMLVGSMPELEWGIYLLVGISTLWLLVMHPKECRACMGR